MFLFMISSTIISYLTVMWFFWKPRPELGSIFINKKMDVSFIFYLFLIALGFAFARQPLFDFNRINDYLFTSSFEPYKHPFKGFTEAFLYTHIIALILSPFFEELFYRSFLFSKLLTNYAPRTAIIIVSLCFALTHFDLINILPTFIYSVIACLIYLKTKNIYYLLFIHFLNNFFIMLLNIYGEYVYPWIYDQQFGFTYWVLVSTGIVLIYFGVSKILKYK